MANGLNEGWMGALINSGKDYTLVFSVSLTPAEVTRLEHPMF